MIPLALALVGVAIWALVWAIRTGQFDELESHGWTPILDDDERPAADPGAARKSAGSPETESAPDRGERPVKSADPGTRDGGGD
jgi:cbb3-type cytochrome oxidase maturation protein